MSISVAKPFPAREMMRLAITCGEPAGIGPDLLIQIAQQAHLAELIYIGDPQILRQRAARHGLPLQLQPVHFEHAPTPNLPGQLKYYAVESAASVVPGQLNRANSAYVLAVLQAACLLCASDKVDAMVTPPVHKGVINDAGIAFSGHTEFLQDYFASPQVVMLMANAKMKVALATTHLPLSQVPAAITQPLLTAVISTLHQGLQQQFGIAQPRIRVCGLNPHAGEGGHLGREEIDVIAPCLEQLRQNNWHLTGPVAADTAFLPEQLDQCDAIVAMYHDQGLAAIKFADFAQTVNITLGLPIIRTSVDHGTALELAGSLRGDTRSLQSAINWALHLCAQRSRN
jgi:4-hydroxythreonine-4-phosphate dehydrogenase